MRENRRRKKPFFFFFASTFGRGACREKVAALEPVVDVPEVMEDDDAVGFVYGLSKALKSLLVLVPKSWN